MYSRQLFIKHFVGSFLCTVNVSFGCFGTKSQVQNQVNITWGICDIRKPKVNIFEQLVQLI